MRGLDGILGEILRATRRGRRPRATTSSTQIDGAWAQAPEPARTEGVARDVMLIHMGAQSNLYAALAWTLSTCCSAPTLLEEVRAGDDYCSSAAPASRSAWRSAR